MLGRPVEIVSQHLRWLFAVAHCRWDGGEAIVKRQPPMGRDREQMLWQHRLTEHLADRGVPAARARGLVELDGLWYEVFDLAAGRDVYSGVDTLGAVSQRAHVAAAGAMLARLHEAGASFEPSHGRSRQAGFVVQLGRRGWAPVDAVERMRGRGRPWPTTWRAAPGGEPVGAAYDEPLARIAAAARPSRAAAARRLADQQPLLRGRRGVGDHRLPPGRLAPRGARPGDRRRAQLLLLEPDLGR